MTDTDTPMVWVWACQSGNHTEYYLVLDNEIMNYCIAELHQIPLSDWNAYIDAKMEYLRVKQRITKLCIESANRLAEMIEKVRNSE